MDIKNCFDIFVLFIMISKRLIMCDTPNETNTVVSQSQINYDETATNIETMPIELLKTLKVEPSAWDFGVLPMGTMQTHVFTLINNNVEHSVYLNGVIVLTSAFYSSTFETKLIPPSANDTFSVVFMPRKFGLIRTYVHVHTSFGKVMLQVQGEGRHCPYRLKPIVGIQVPFNATVMSLIYMYNPHNQQLQIAEVYSSGGHFQLELPGGANEAPQQLWQVPPYSTKAIVHIRFRGLLPGRHAAYIRIKLALRKTSNSSIIHLQNDLVIPLEFDVMPDYGLYIENPIIDFSYVAVHKKSKSIRRLVKLKHSNVKFNSTLQWINQSLPLGIQYDKKVRALILKPAAFMELSDNTIHEKRVVLKFVSKQKKIMGKTLTTTTTNHKVIVFVRYHIIKGRLSHEPSITSLTMKDFHNKRKFKFKLINTFAQSVAIYNISLNNAQNTQKNLLLLYPQLHNTDEQMIYLPYNTSTDVILTLVKQNLIEMKTLKTKLQVYTNITVFDIPIKVHSGRLNVFTQTHYIWRCPDSSENKITSNTKLNLGATLNPVYVILENPDGINVKIVNWNMQTVKIARCSITYLGIIQERSIYTKFTNDTNYNKNKSYMTVDLNRTKYNLRNQLNGSDIAVFRIELHPNSRLQNSQLKNYRFSQNMVISTQFENITINIRFFLLEGRLEVDKENLNLENCFPGKVCSFELNIRSTFPYSLHVKAINFIETYLEYVDYQLNNGTKIRPDDITSIGQIYLQPSKLCGSHCYIPDYTEYDMSFPTITTDNNCEITWPIFNESELYRRIELYRQFKWYFQYLHFGLITWESTEFPLQLGVKFSWPQLIKDNHQTLPDVEVNETTEFIVPIKNPAENPILIDYILSVPTLSNDSKLFLPSEMSPLNRHCQPINIYTFALVNTDIKQPILIPANSTTKIAIKFHSNLPGTYRSRLHIRNNLTLYESVLLTAKVKDVQFRLNNLQPNTQTPLVFDMTEEHMADICSLFYNEDSNNILEKKRLRRVFMARNLGGLPIQINGMFIGGQLCQGHGFRIVNCTPFELGPNGSHAIEIIFVPDFTFNHIAVPFILKANNSKIYQYTLTVHLSQKGLEKCHKLLPRPYWESIIRQYALIILSITFILVHIAVLIDYKRIYYEHVRLMNATDYKNDVQPTFNLQQISHSVAQNTESNNSPIKNSPSKKKKSNANKKSHENDIKKDSVPNNNQIRKRCTNKKTKIVLSSTDIMKSKKHNLDNNASSPSSTNIDLKMKKMENNNSPKSKVHALEKSNLATEIIDTTILNPVKPAKNHQNPNRETKLNEMKYNKRCNEKETDVSTQNSCKKIKGKDKQNKAKDIKLLNCDVEHNGIDMKIVNSSKQQKSSNKINNNNHNNNHNNNNKNINNNCNDNNNNNNDSKNHNKSNKNQYNNNTNANTNSNMNTLYHNHNYYKTTNLSKSNNDTYNNVNRNNNVNNNNSNSVRRTPGKTPGRERRKNINYTKEATPQCMSFSNSTSSCSSSTCSSTSLNRINDDKRYDYISDLNGHYSNPFSNMYSNCNVRSNSELFNERLHDQYCLTPPLISFRDVLQSQPIMNTQTATTSIPTGNLWQSSECLGNTLSSHHKPSPNYQMNELGPIGSRKTSMVSLPQPPQNQRQLYMENHNNYDYGLITTAPYQAKWQSNDYECTLTQQQQKRFMDFSNNTNNTISNNNWQQQQFNINRWSPLVGCSNENNIINPNNNNNLHNPWNIPLIRPPPGLENKYIPARHHSQYPTTAATLKNTNTPLVNQCPSTRLTLTTTAGPNITSNAMSPAAIARPNITANGMSPSTSNMLLYDPFGLSDIWANSNNNNNTNSNNTTTNNGNTNWN